MKAFLSFSLFFLIFQSATYSQATVQSCSNNSNGTFAECSFTGVTYDQCNPRQVQVQYLNNQGGNNYMHSISINLYNGNGTFVQSLYSHSPSGQIFGSNTTFTASSTWRHVTLNPMPAWALATNGRFRIDIEYYWCTSGNNCEGGTVSRWVYLDTPLAPSAPTLSSNTCNTTTFTWNNGPSLVCLDADAYTQIWYGGGSLIATVPRATTTYTVSTIGDHNYVLRHIHFKNGATIYGAWGPWGSSPTKQAPDPPAGFEASTDRCDNKIRLEWIPVQNATKYHIYRDGAFIYDTGSGGAASYVDDDTSLIRGQNYNYTIKAQEGDCGWSVPSLVTTGVSPAEPNGVENVWLDIVPNVGMEITFNDDNLAESFKIERNLLGGGGASIFNVPAGDTSYLDQSLTICQTYEYRVLSINSCATQGLPSDSVRQGAISPDFSSVFNSKSLEATKGYYPNRIELTWTVDNNVNNIDGYKIYRRVLGSSLDSILITSQNSGTNLYQDNLTDAGVLYEYFIVAEAQCEQSTIYSNTTSSIGFRSVTGTIAGQVNYAGGVAVENVRIEATNSTGAIGSSVLFSGNDSIVVSNNNNFDIVNELTSEFWFMPNNNLNYTLVEKEEVFSIKHIGSNFVFEVFSAPGVSQSVLVSDANIVLNNYNQFSATLLNDTIRLYINGLNSSFALFNGNINSNAKNLVYGENFEGNIDEIRLWNMGKDSLMVGRDFTRQLNGLSPNLKVYLRLNENIGDIAYDFSRINNNSFNKNHGQFFGNLAWSNTIPLSSQLATATYTDAQGNYFLSIPYSGIGQTFVITPSYLIHNFSPATQALFIGDGSSVYNNIDFEDISSFTVQGSLFFANTSCPVEGATLKVDGDIVISNGQPAQTDAGGQFNIQVPIGNHFITIEKNNHIMNVGRFPDTSTYDFQNDLAGIEFQDTTLVKVVGRVAGGLKEASYILGLGKSKNNIGQAQIIFNSQLGNGCASDTLLTDFNTGEYITYLPPLRYVPTVTVPSNLTINFGTLNLVDITNDLLPVLAYDTIGYDSLNNVYFIDSISYNKQLDYIYINNPKLIVKAENLIDDFIGDTLYTYTHPNGSVVERNLKTNPLPWPVFNGISEEKEYICLITAYEEYLNLQTNVLDTVPTTDGDLIFNNDLTSFSQIAAELGKVNTLDSLKYLVYTFPLGTPNFNENVSIPEYSYVKQFELNLSLPNGTTIPWKPDVFNGTGSANFNTNYDQIFRAYVLGAKTDGQQFFTEGPQIPEYVLRDPPGSASSASREVGSEKSTENEWSWGLGGSVNAEDKIFLGAKFTTGLGLSVETENENNVTAGFSASFSGGRSGTQSTTITNTQEWGTNANNDSPGKNSDLYIGKSKNVSFGISETLKLVPDSLCNQVECLDSLDFFSMGKTYGVTIVPGGYSTQFIYSEEFIKDQLIPDLVSLRNAYLSSSSKYISHIPISNPNYGLNNDNPIITGDTILEDPFQRIQYLLRLGDSTYTQFIPTYGNEEHRTSSANQRQIWDTYDSYNSSDFVTITGNSYDYLATNLQDSLTGDSVRWLNNQIEHWEEAIMLNEWEKVNINNGAVRTALRQKEMKELYDRFKEPIIAYTALVSTSGPISGIGTLASVVTPYPGATIGGAVTLGITTGAGIATAEVYEEVLEYESQKQLIVDKFAQTSANYSISSGNTFTSAISHETASSYTKSIEYGMSSSLALEMAGKISNTGVGFERSLEIEFESYRDWSKSNSASETLSFTLDEPDQGDFFSVDVHPSLLGWGPVFKLQPGGKTSCPHEDVLLTEYYLENPNNLNGANPYSPSFVLSEATQQVDKPTIGVAPSLLTNVPVNDPAVFNLTINNESESGDTRTYSLALMTTSNPFGAIVTVDGSTSFADVTIAANSSINKVLSIEKGPGPTYDYDSLIIIVYSDCEPDIVDSVYVNAHFLPTCTEINFANPNDQWVLNNSFNDTMLIGIIDYNINFFDFNSIRLDYKPSSQANWIGLKTFHKDTAGLNDPTAQEIPTNTPFTLWDWETDQIVDGDYDLRLVSQCTLADKISVTHSGLMDRINPHPFGTPSPADGILDPNDDISIRFNEPIDLGSITSQNFDVRGIINGTETNHSSNLYFDGVDDYVEVTAGLPIQNRDFTIEFSAKRTTTGAECIMSQGDDVNEQLYIGFNAANQLEVRFNNQAIVSANTFTGTNWHYFSVAYNEQNESLEIFEASGISTAALINPGNTSLFENFSGVNKLLIGKDAAGIGNYFTGNIDDIRIWNKTRTLAEFSLTKSQLLSGSELGLLYNWKFDDADGIFANDHVRQRDAEIFGPTWTIEPQGNAVSFDGIDDYIRVDKGNVNITDEMDFTLEFWFNSAQTDSATLFSNGTGTGLSSDSIFSWNIAKDDAGMIHVYHNGLDFIATNNDYFDGEWHHFALVLNRQANLTSYIDGNLENSVQALPYREFGGSGLYLGSRGYYTGLVENFDKHFNGQIDEFRLWNTARTYEQIARDKQNRMLGTEMGLRMYLPFENYTLSATNVPILTSSFDEQILNNVVANPNGSVLNNTPPKIKLQRPIESIAFTYSINGDEIIITPTTSAELIENVTLDITVEGIKDLNGNIMQSPKTWIAYMDKNQVVWQDDLLTFNKDFGTGLTFTSAVVNNGGAAKLYDITNLPAWLTANQTSGTIAPNSVEQITFTIDPNVNIGNYLEDIHLTTDFGFAERLTIDLKVRAEEPAWTVNPANFTNSMSIIGYIEINDVVSTSEEDILAVFVNDTCRGAAHLEYVAQLDRYLVFLDVYSNVNNGEALDFKVWDASAGMIFSEILPGNLSFVANDLIGTTSAPQLFETSYEIEVAIPLNTGWNWIGHFLQNPDSLNLDATLESLESVTGDEIKGISNFSNYLANTGWVGSLNATGIVPQDGYKLKVSQVDTLVITGDILDPVSRTINLAVGWNWIGFISVRNQSVAQALGNLNPTNGDIIKAQSQFAVYDNTLGWVGSLQTMKPGTGYMFYTTVASSFVYPAVGQFKYGTVNQNDIYKNKVWTVENNAFASNMTMISALEIDCDYIKDNASEIVIGVFDDEANCRAVNTIDLLENNNLYSFLTVGGKNSNNLNFAIMDTKTGRNFDLVEKTTFNSNERKGTINEPMMLKISDEICFKMQFEKTEEDDIASSILVKDAMQVYPTIFEDNIDLYYLGKNEDKISMVRLYNLWGQLVFETSFSSAKGYQKMRFDLSKKVLPTGVYHFIVEDENDKMHSFKIVKK
ncbi:MAG: LamG-like jellyroll fold domain-containing protein [Chitinophagales bacterium]